MIHVKSGGSNSRQCNENLLLRLRRKTASVRRRSSSA
jgi:hypothetical protein